MRALRAAGLETDASGESPFGVVLFDRVDEGLLELCRARSRGGLTRIVALGVDPTPSAGTAVWLLLAAGATEVLPWRGEPSAAERIVAQLEHWGSVDELVESEMVRRNLVGSSTPWLLTLREVVQMARFTDASVLIEGESGTGKELLARLIHTLDPREAKGKLVVLDCTTISPELSGSEFFGHERGAFTGAVAARRGAFALADGGTLLLDEIGDLPLSLQAKLLRVIQEGSYKPVGGEMWKHTSFRLVCATHRDLRAEIERGAFRADLYHRIASLVCRVPPLRRRSDDVLVLARHFLAELKGTEEDTIELDSAVETLLAERDYPGNVRDLRQLVTRIHHRHTGPGPVSVGDVPVGERPLASGLAPEPAGADLDACVRRMLGEGLALKAIGRAAEDAAIRIALQDTDTLKEASRRLGVTERAIQLRRAKRGVQATAADR